MSPGGGGTCSSGGGGGRGSVGGGGGDAYPFVPVSFMVTVIQQCVKFGNVLFKASTSAKTEYFCRLADTSKPLEEPQGWTECETVEASLEVPCNCGRAIEEEQGVVGREKKFRVSQCSQTLYN